MLGGKVEQGESLEEAVRTEVKEEAGVDIGEVVYVGNFRFQRPDGYYMVGLEFACEYQSGKPAAGDDMDNYEVADFRGGLSVRFYPGRA